MLDWILAGTIVGGAIRQRHEQVDAAAEERERAAEMRHAELLDAVDGGNRSEQLKERRMAEWRRKRSVAKAEAERKYENTVKFWTNFGLFCLAAFIFKIYSCFFVPTAGAAWSIVILTFAIPYAIYFIFSDDSDTGFHIMYLTKSINVPNDVTLGAIKSVKNPEDRYYYAYVINEKENPNYMAVIGNIIKEKKCVGYFKYNDWHCYVV